MIYEPVRMEPVSSAYPECRLMVDVVVSVFQISAIFGNVTYFLFQKIPAPVQP